MTEFLSAAVRAIERAGAQFGDVRLEERTAFVVRVANEQIQNVNQVHRRGWGLRAFVDGAWGYASGTSTALEAVLGAARKAVAIARGSAAAGVSKSKLRKMPSSKKAYVPKIQIEPRDVSGEEKVAAAMEVSRAQRRDGIANTNASYNDSDWKFELANTWGAHLRWREIRVRIAGQAVAGEGARREAAYEFRDGTVGWELVKALDLGEFGRRVASEAVAMLHAAKPPAGLTTVVTDPGVSGLLAHEVMGHASEGDEIVKARSFLTHQVGKRVGSALVSMYDDGTYPGAHGSIPFDAEGTAARKTPVIERGIYRGFLHSLETSGVLHARPTGNGRAQDFGRRVWVRMTNTYFGPGRDRRDEILEETKSGVLTKSWISGMEDPVGGAFQGVTQSGFRIKKGEVAERIRGMTLTGAALTILKSVDMVSREIQLDGGTCGKGEEDYVPVAALGATVARRAAENLRARAFKGKLAGIAVVDPMDLGEIFLTTVGSAVNGEDVHKSRSPWAGKVGQDVASAGVTIRDRPRMAGGLASGVVDDEGSATRDRTLVEAAVLRGFLADCKHSALVGMPAGNGYQRAVATVEGAYTRPAETEPSNLVVEPGRRSLDELLAEVDAGVYVEKFAAPEVNPFSGAFAMEFRNATLIQKGGLNDHVKVALLTGNFYDGLKNVVGIGRDLAATHGFLSAPGCAYVPTIAFEGFELVGQA